MTWRTPLIIAIHGALILIGVHEHVYTVAIIGGIGIMGAGYLLGMTRGSVK